jgi:N-acetylmuramoyl-L-alanine amidase
LKKALTLSTFYKFMVIKFCIVFTMIGVIILSLSQQVSYAANPFLNEIKIVVLDPGHGGDDNGVQGPAGTLEKSVALGLARLVAGQLKKDYKVKLTRSDDYWIDIPDRTAVANHLKANLFISIHTGGSFLHQAKGITIFHYKKLSGHALEIDAHSSKPEDTGNPQALWNNIQAGHITSSKALAQKMQNNFNSQVNFSKSKIQNADLMVLKGADMPAILIEVGYLSNPGDEKKLQSPEVLSDFAKAICNGIDDYFQNSQN